LEKRGGKAMKKKIEKLVEQAYYRTCSGIQIDIMDIGKVFRTGVAAYEAGARDAALDKAVRDFVETIRRD